MRRWLLAALLLLLPLTARAQEEEPLVAALSRNEIEVTTGFTGASLVVFGSTAAPIGPGGDEVLVVARGPTRAVVVRRKVPVAGVVWVNGPSARFAQVPGYYVIAGTRPAWQILPEEQRLAHALGLDSLPLTSTGARSPGFRAALLDLEKQSGLWLEHTEPVEIAGSRLFHVRLPLPAAVPTGDYRVEVYLVRSRRIVARQELAFRVDRMGAADRIATVAQAQPLLYGLACIAFAAFAGWLGSVLFRRG
ncbi:TIGR02186 family protein [Roseicella aquatilis]|uniref:TIGR02186 family protein n=1 Tax=Roseicella aquatilis TaxID=2527868 RepID=A0A4R4DD21_9PROT|nr:TIGR02186 family protein [Roseicella aquatilis]TCZ57247.1 hypothetical protein EXY23_18095 [Roseicella aquatilis]